MQRPMNMLSGFAANTTHAVRLVDLAIVLLSCWFTYRVWLSSFAMDGRYLGGSRLAWWPLSLLATAMKLMGYQLGKQHRRFPARLRKALSMHKGYWT